ncbi:uncharacterized protein SCHCODRAFT_02612045 [Schizophyllum commune H4-8]|uniref:uncharacterized protein n=1 Tax=Schizophyllum commune (strain H4-8 / FGSC 9210) TaxID=578458 RepID=UPI00215E249F|nr:uncharacterized protein SCHCODRAFT_02612045 [Schizophyllum commune H4-8]KAI5898418.1 hypothetical protein SCHCODRAFT_02612045 [Schizophyllum commune H4-8]
MAERWTLGSSRLPNRMNLGLIIMALLVVIACVASRPVSVDLDDACWNYNRSAVFNIY